MYRHSRIAFGSKASPFPRLPQVDGARRELANAPRPDLVITDIRLPDGSGAEIFELPSEFSWEFPSSL